MAQSNDSVIPESPPDQDDQKNEVASAPISDAEESKTSEMMKVIFASATGEPEKVLQIKELPIPKISKPNQVLVKVEYAAINPIDWKIVIGRMGPASSRKPAHVPGSDFSGRVIAKGDSPALKDLNIGDMVFGNPFGGTGSFAEYAVVDAACITKMPACISAVAAAAVPLVTQTSFQALKKLKVDKKTKLLIFGGSTSTGLMASQIAKRHIGCAEVIVTSSQEELCKKAGADRVINYKTEKWEEILKNYGVDAIYDCVGGVDYWDNCRSEGVLKKNGRYVTIVGDTNHGGKLTVGSLMGSAASMANRKFWSSMGYQSYDLILTNSKADMPEIAAMIEAGKLEPVLDPDSPYKFEDFLKMFEKSMSHRAKGKLVIQIATDSAETESKDDVKEAEEQPNESNPPDAADAEKPAMSSPVEDQQQEDAPSQDDPENQLDGNAAENDD